VKRSERGFSLIEALVTVVIIGIAFTVFVAGMGAAVLDADYHRKQAVVQASVRNFAEAIKAAPFDANCPTAKASYAGALNPSAVFSGATSHIAPTVQPVGKNSAHLTFFALSSSSSFTPPAGMTEVYDVASQAALILNGITATLDDELWDQAGETGPRTDTSALSADSVAQTVSLEASNKNPTSIVRLGSSTNQTTGATSLAITKPANTTNGTVMLAQIALRAGAGATVTAPPSGWQLVQSRANGTSVKSLLYIRVATNSDANSYTWTFTPSQDAAGGIVSYGGVATGYTASVTDVKFWSSGSTPTFAASCPTAGDLTRLGVQEVSIQIDAVDGRASQTIDVVKRNPGRS